MLWILLVFLSGFVTDRWLFIGLRNFHGKRDRLRIATI